MAADNSPPRTRPIIITALIAVTALVGLKFVFDSYYVTMFEAEEYRKVGSVQPAELQALHAAEKKAFAAAPVPIDRAVDYVVKGRGDPLSDPKAGDITAQTSLDNAPLVGWAQSARVPPAGFPSSAPPGSAAPASIGSAVPATSGSASAPAGSTTPGAASAAPGKSSVPAAGASSAAPPSSGPKPAASGAPAPGPMAPRP